MTDTELGLRIGFLKQNIASTINDANIINRVQELVDEAFGPAFIESNMDAWWDELTLEEKIAIYNGENN